GEALTERAAALLAEGAVAGWFQGRMEFGPRALGHRSILADPRGREAQRQVNLKIKFRESFRPFAPSVPEERAAEHFDLDPSTGSPRLRSGPAGQAAESPYMLLVAPVRGAETGGEGLDRRHHVASALPAVTHVDGSARVHT